MRGWNYAAGSAPAVRELAADAGAGLDGQCVALSEKTEMVTERAGDREPSAGSRRAASAPAPDGRARRTYDRIMTDTCRHGCVSRRATPKIPKMSVPNVVRQSGLGGVSGQHGADAAGGVRLADGAASASGDGGTADSEAALRRVRRRFINRDNLRGAIRRIVNETLAARDVSLWGHGTSCASDSVSTPSHPGPVVTSSARPRRLRPRRTTAGA